MTTQTANGRTPSQMESEATHYSNPEAEWENYATETHYSNPEGEMEDEWEAPEAHYSNPEAHYSNPYSNPEMEEEWEAPEAHYANPEAAYANPELEEEWETEAHEAAYANPEMSYSNPYSQPEMEEEWESHEAHYANPEDESDQFLPFLAPLAAKALPMLAKAVLPTVRRLIPVARRAASSVARNILGGATPAVPAGARPQAVPGMPGGGPTPRAAGWRPGARPLTRSRRATVSSLLRQLSAVLGEGETEAAALEAELFGANEFEGELAAHEAAHEAALTEVLAAEAAHTEDESEAEALLGTALPITIRITGGRRALRPVTPTLVQANARLVRSLHRRGPGGRQLVRLVPTIQRRTMTSLRAASRAGRPITPTLAAQVMAGQAARVLGTPHICGRALVRNTAIRRATVAPAGYLVRRRRPVAS